MKRDFILPEQDSDYLDSKGFQWETIRDQSGLWVIIQNYPIPVGYNYRNVHLALKIDAGYPVTQIDMAYFNPHLQKTNGNNKPIGALAGQPIAGTVWQRWSRHRTGENPWRVGLDDISTHLLMVNNWLERELIK